MPFKSRAQLRVCYSKQYHAKKSGQRSSWDCDRWLKETPNPQNLPERLGEISRKKSKDLKRGENKDSKCSYTPGKDPKSKREKVCIGPRGGKYIIRGGIKVYISRLV